MLQDIDDADWILQPALAPALRAMAARGLVFDALVTPLHLPHLLALAGRYPGLRMVIDHGAKPDIAGGQWQPWADGIAASRAETAAVCKLSGLLTEAGRTPLRGAVQRWAAHVLACFGPERVLWGSDWPVLELAGELRAIGGTKHRQLLAPLDDADRAAVLGANARHVYRL